MYQTEPATHDDHPLSRLRERVAEGRERAIRNPAQNAADRKINHHNRTTATPASLKQVRRRDVILWQSGHADHVPVPINAATPTTRP